MSPCYSTCAHATAGAPLARDRTGTNEASRQIALRLILHADNSETTDSQHRHSAPPSPTRIRSRPSVQLPTRGGRSSTHQGRCHQRTRCQSYDQAYICFPRGAPLCPPCPLFWDQAPRHNFNKTNSPSENTINFRATLGSQMKQR